MIADELRQARVERKFRVKAPAGKAIASYHESYASTPARLVQVRPAPAWLGHRSRGVAIDGLAPAPVFRISGHGWTRVKTRDGVIRVRALTPTAPLGAFSLGDAWSSIRAALVQDAQGSVFDNWLMRRESARSAVDDLPEGLAAGCGPAGAHDRAAVPGAGFLKTTRSCSRLPSVPPSGVCSSSSRPGARRVRMYDSG